MKMICPHCGLKGTAEETLVGKKVRCPECQQIFRVEDDVLASVEANSMEQVVNSADEAVSEQLEEQLADVADSEDSIDATIEVQEVEIELADGVQVCSKCGFALSEQFLQETDSEVVCSICAA